MTEKWGVTDAGEQWEVHVENDRLILTHYAGPFGLPVSRVSMKPGSVESVAKSLIKARNSTKRRRPTSTGEHS